MDNQYVVFYDSKTNEYLGKVNRNKLPMAFMNATNFLIDKRFVENNKEKEENNG